MWRRGFRPGGFRGIMWAISIRIRGRGLARGRVRGGRARKIPGMSPKGETILTMSTTPTNTFLDLEPTKQPHYGHKKKLKPFIVPNTKKLSLPKFNNNAKGSINQDLENIIFKRHNKKSIKILKE